MGKYLPVQRPKKTITIVASIVCSLFRESRSRYSGAQPQSRSYSLTNSGAGPGLHWESALDARLVQVEADGNVIAGMAAVAQVVSILVVIHIQVIVVVPIA